MVKSPKTKDTIQETLDERGTNYGSYEVGTQLRADIMELIKQSYRTNNNSEMPAFYQVAILDIVNKLSRLAATPNHLDSYHDISGYATLVENYLKKTNTGR